MSSVENSAVDVVKMSLTLVILVFLIIFCITAMKMSQKLNDKSSSAFLGYQKEITGNGGSGSN